MTHPTAAHLAVAPVGAWDRLAIVALGSAGCALSYDALQQMAVAIHVRGFLTYLFPLVIDGFIAYGVRALLVLSQAPLRARLYVWTLFGTATAASIWANALHAVRLNQQTTHSGLRLGDTVVAVLSTLAPLALAGAVHLYILITRHHPGAGGPADRPKKAPKKRRTNLVRRMRTKLRRKSNGQRTTADLTARTTDHRPEPGALDERTDSAVDHEHRPAPEPGPGRADHSPSADQMPDHERPRTMERPTEAAPADHDATRTIPARDHADEPGDHDAPAADQQLAAGPQEADRERRTSNAAGQAAPSPHGPADPERGPAEGSGPASADQGAPADQMSDREHPRTTDDAVRTTDQPAVAAPADDATAADQRTNPAPDHADHDGDHDADQPGDHDAPTANQPLDQPADQDDDGSSGGPQGARTTGHGAPAPDQRTKPADQDDEVPWEVKVEVARRAALQEGLMSRRIIRPHLRRNNISISNEHFRVLQDQLYADPALAHLPRDKRRSR
ncbi:hypothetical protein ADL29_17805 [Streptomyces chattanoogensis]|uniref:DUF2637 domain-containing protein n=1 Tax=Streptomyces chattanoogensis TaxID=66876 RepID=A0A0N1JXR8_9ACTN|nr:hypothetical protein ADL29_17805 [Streptomyces chattanoogensis]